MGKPWKNNIRNRGGNGGQKLCNICGKNNHNTNECKFKNKKFSDNNNNKVKKNRNDDNHISKNGRRKSSGNNFNNQSKHTQSICTKCGLKGHEIWNCNAKQITENERCDCESEYHRSHQCPWNQDPTEREKAQNQSTGKICQWCKDAGDGMHVYHECKEPVKFRNALMKKIERAYDELQWCWHCSSTDHRTRGCSSHTVEAGKMKWNTVVTDIINEWVNYDASSYKYGFRDDDDDITMGIPRRDVSPPDPSDYRWCILCQNFGHQADAGEEACNRDDYERKVPAQMRNKANAIEHHYGVKSSPSSTIGKTGSYNTFGVSKDQIFRLKCQNDGCRQKINWPINCSEKGMTQICQKCGVPNYHPSMPRHDPQLKTLELFLNYLKSANSATDTRRKTKKERIEAIKNEYMKRPSMALSKKLIRNDWPKEQPRYLDLSENRVDRDPIFQPNHFFNYQGNHQPYFPSIRFRLKEEWLDIMEDNELPINKAGRLGLELQCLRCEAKAKVLDGEEDIVMCGTHAMNTAGCGSGRWTWLDESGYRSNACKCLTVLGHQPYYAWVTPKAT